MYQLIGVLCGLAIYNGIIININLPLALYKKLLRRPLALCDLTEIQPAVGRCYYYCCYFYYSFDARYFRAYASQTFSS